MCTRPNAGAPIITVQYDSLYLRRNQAGFFSLQRRRQPVHPNPNPGLPPNPPPPPPRPEEQDNPQVARHDEPGTDRDGTDGSDQVKV